ncbi:CopD family protein [Methylocystis hirsuta]|uniref:Copper resistance protein D domain-containing protein n=1 Tax=Methylocystis hirsuta TaxID=369798 RepID=A0A3M9XJ24_9HYPH|nr:CopD family protein [Methylocystis hirsuta]RNJ48147.1 hypothetical protein D1O30_20210 [Methylocystis hirsuta]
MTAVLVAARLLQFLAATILFGTSLFPFYALPPGVSDETGQVAQLSRGALVLAALAASVSALAWVAVSIIDLADDPGAIFDAETMSQYFFETSFGKIWLLRLALVFALMAVALVARRRLFARNVATGLIAVVAALLLVSQAWIGHPASLPAAERLVVILAYALHVLGGALWLGALLPLGFLVASARRGETALPVAEFALRRFSPAGMGAIAAILLGGLINLTSRADSFDVLAASGWGQIAMSKAAILAGMIAAAAINRFVLMSRFSASPARSLAALTRSIVFEQAAGLLILAATAFMAVFHPPGTHH